jgi:hypothetical protein
MLIKTKSYPHCVYKKVNVNKNKICSWIPSQQSPRCSSIQWHSKVFRQNSNCFQKNSNCFQKNLSSPHTLPSPGSSTTSQPELIFFWKKFSYPPQAPLLKQNSFSKEISYHSWVQVPLFEQNCKKKKKSQNLRYHSWARARLFWWQCAVVFKHQLPFSYGSSATILILFKHILDSIVFTKKKKKSATIQGVERD